MLLAGDVGGTKTLLGLFARAPTRPTPVATAEFSTLSYASIEDMIEAFLTSEHERRIEAVSLGVAGVVTRDVARLTNVPWVVDASAVRDRFRVRRITLLNDLQAMGYSIPVLRADELAVLQKGEPKPEGNAAVIAAGTGLGEALLHNVDGRFIPSPTEGGHADFAPRTLREVEFFHELVRIFGRAEYEQVISGLGLANLARFTHRGTDCADLKGVDPATLPAAVTGAAMNGKCVCCEDALDIFLSVYGAEAGNLALHSLATAGVYVGGGIAPKILPVLEDGRFMNAFRAKGSMAQLMATIPVSVILNRQCGLLGAAVHANGSA